SAATEAGSLNGVLSRLFHTALSVGKRARSETNIGSYAASVSAAAVALANRTFGTLENHNVLIISAGSTGKLAARSLMDTGARILVTNRTYSRAVAIAGNLAGEAVAFDSLAEALAQADVVISATGAGQFVVGPELVRTALAGRSQRPLLLIDIAVPRDIDPAVRELPGVVLNDIDDLQSFAPPASGHSSEIAHVEAIVEEELARFLAWWTSLDAVPVIASLKEQAERIRRREVEKAFRRLPGLSDEEKQRVEAMTEAIINKLLHEPITRLKAGDDPGTHIEALQQLFDLTLPRDRE
ncbi:MAG TPA: glutamyl-tRNA reductase, partial [Dehalococcoidia bacterium]|nr:glutamyl-tRNA reductase [Dehalococcoidia bacterium]